MLFGVGVGAFDNHIGLAETFLDIAPFINAGLAFPNISVGLNLRRIRPHGLLKIDDMRQGFVFDFNELQGISGD